MAVIGQNISQSIITRYGGGAGFGDVIYGPRGQYGPLTQRDYQIVLILEGSLELQVDGKWREVTPGHAVLCLPGRRTFFVFDRERRTRHQWCALHPKAIDPQLRRGIGNRGGIIAIPPVMPTLLQAAWEAGRENTAADLIFLRSLADATFAAFLAARRLPEDARPVEPEPLRKARHYINAHYAEPMTLGDIAARAAVTPNHLIRLFREHGGVTPMESLWQVRLGHGFTWLRETGLSISEIAARAGFQNAFHFSRRFKSKHEKSPRAYRQSLIK